MGEGESWLLLAMFGHTSITLYELINSQFINLFNKNDLHENFHVQLHHMEIRIVSRICEHERSVSNPWSLSNHFSWFFCQCQRWKGWKSGGANHIVNMSATETVLLTIETRPAAPDNKRKRDEDNVPNPQCSGCLAKEHQIDLLRKEVEQLKRVDELPLTIGNLHHPNNCSASIEDVMVHADYSKCKECRKWKHVDELSQDIKPRRGDKAGLTCRACAEAKDEGLKARAGYSTCKECYRWKHFDEMSKPVQRRRWEGNTCEDCAAQAEVR